MGPWPRTPLQCGNCIPAWCFAGGAAASPLPHEVKPAKRVRVAEAASEQHPTWQGDGDADSPPISPFCTQACGLLARVAQTGAAGARQVKDPAVLGDIGNGMAAATGAKG